MQADDISSTVPHKQPFRLGHWQVEPATGRIMGDGKSIKLEPRVMDVLVYLAQQPGLVIPREELEDVIWEGRVVGYDALTSTMRKLRKSLQDDARKPRYIETVSKRGYRLIVPIKILEESTPTLKAMPRSPRRILIAISTLSLLVFVTFISLLLWKGNTEIATVIPPSNSIAVLPFKNLANTHNEDYLAAGITDDLITSLAKHPGLLVIARDSSFLHKEEVADIRDIAKQLNVQYILTGSMRRSGDKVHVNTQLINAVTGSHLWAEHYERNSSDIFEVQDAIIQKIKLALAVTLHNNDQRIPLRPKTRILAAYDYFLDGRYRFFRYASKQENDKARALYQQALELDPQFAMASAMLAWTHAFDAMNGWSSSRKESLDEALQHAQQAIRRDKNIPIAYFVSGLVYREQGAHLKAKIEAEKALSLEPSYANAHILLATLLYYSGQAREGLALIKRAMQLNPHYPYNYPFHLGQAYFILGQYTDAIDAFEDGLASNPSSERLRVWLAVTYAQSGRISDAQWEKEQILTLNPVFSSERIRKAFPFKNPADLERFSEGLRLAGLPK